MNIFPHNSVAGSAPFQRRGQRAFTMIEIALAIGVIGFALVAIIGLLPAGMNVQKNNREDTIISQDAPYFLNAIRNGEQRTNHNILRQYVESITISNVTDGGVPVTNWNETLVPGSPNGTLSNDFAIVGLLSTPAYDRRAVPDAGGNMVTNQVTAIVRAMTGSATEQGGSNATMAFRYAVNVEVLPWTTAPFTEPMVTNPIPINLDPVESNFLYSLQLKAQGQQTLTNSMHEVRLKFSWPVLPNGTVGPYRQIFRTLVAGHLSVTNSPPAPLYWYFQPNYYTNDFL